jgi:serine/threonine-protein kinase
VRRAPDHFEDRAYQPGKAGHPVTFVNWFDPRIYRAWAGKRLPTLREWEKAARGSDGREFPWGNECSIDRVNTGHGEELGVMPVGSLPAGCSPYGVEDMAGNVMEWIADWYCPIPAATMPCRITTSASSSCAATAGAASAVMSSAASAAPDSRFDDSGFRCARDLTSPGVGTSL